MMGMIQVMLLLALVSHSSRKSSDDNTAWHELTVWLPLVLVFNSFRDWHTWQYWITHSGRSPGSSSDVDPLVASRSWFSLFFSFHPVDSHIFRHLLSIRLPLAQCSILSTSCRHRPRRLSRRGCDLKRKHNRIHGYFKVNQNGNEDNAGCSFYLETKYRMTEASSHSSRARKPRKISRERRTK